MKRRYERKLPQLAPTDAPPEIQKGTSRGAGKDERLKREVRQHPQRDEPRIDSIEPGDMPR